jgi:hypothetical protein
MNTLKEVREERDMLADEARQMNDYLKRLDLNTKKHRFGILL